jgi:hypothetical protein
MLLPVAVSLRRLQDSNFLPSFPPTVPLTDSSFPPRGPLERVPPLQQYYEEFRLPTNHPDALRSLRLSVPHLRRLFAPAGTDATPAGPGLYLPVAHPAIDAEIVGPPRFLWHPCAHAPLIDPGETSPPRHSGGSVLPSAMCTTSALTITLLSGLIHAACSLPVYASQLGLPQNHATLGSRLVASLCRAGFAPAGYLRKVSVVSTSRPPCTSFPGARTRRGAPGAAGRKAVAIH